jgi:phosphonate transport system permease protein
LDRHVAELGIDNCNPAAARSGVAEVVPSFIANLFTHSMVNLRAAIPLGVFGSGGIGFEFDFADRLLRYKDMLAYGLIIIVLITRIERLSDLVRRLLPQE